MFILELVVAVSMPTRKVLATMQMTIDGVAEWPAYHDQSDEDDSDFWEAMYASCWDSVDTLLLGRQTYQKWSGFWPGVRKNKTRESTPVNFRSSLTALRRSSSHERWNLLLGRSPG
jgi:hypothetical protein